MTFAWKKAIIVVVDVVIAVYMLLAITAFNEPYGSDAVCSQVKIDIGNGINNGFLDADEIKKLLQSKRMYPLGQPLKMVNTRSIEEFLRRSPFVDDAQCYKSGSGNVCITLTQRTPVVRVKASNGDDYYVDNHGGLMPNTKYAADIIIATGDISRNYARKVLSRVGSHIASDKFWRNQVEQINVLSDGSMEIVPRVGDHIAYLGDPVFVQRKLKRLEKFYKYGLSQAGWNKYSYVSVEFDNQIICKRKQINTEQ